MKNGYGLTFFIFLILASVSCDKKSYAQKDVFCTVSTTGDTIVLDYNKTVPVFTPCEQNLHATITGIMDSRCPKDVNCIWAGKLSVVLKIDALFSVTLEQNKVIDTTYNNNHYSFQLIDVLPYPVAQPPTSVNDKKAIVRIMKQQ